MFYAVVMQMMVITIDRHLTKPGVIIDDEPVETSARLTRAAVYKGYMIITNSSPRLLIDPRCNRANVDGRKNLL